MNIQWYPGHMTKARREMESSMKLVDMIIELADARVPLSSRNPDIDRLGRGKYRMIILNKSDLADEKATRSWENWFRNQGYSVIRMDSRSSAGMKSVENTILTVCKEKLERDKRRGIKNRPIRAMVAGIPNVGKSTFINSMARKSCAKTGNRPGVTKGNQWIRLNKTVELLDTPGILWPKFEDEAVGIRLALLGSVSDEVLNLTELAVRGIRLMQQNYPDALSARYEGIDLTRTPAECLAQIAEIRKALKKGGEPDTDKASKLFLEDLRAGRLGRITLELPPLSAETDTNDKRAEDSDGAHTPIDGKEDSHGC